MCGQNLTEIFMTFFVSLQQSYILMNIDLCRLVKKCDEHIQSSAALSSSVLTQTLFSFNQSLPKAEKIFSLSIFPPLANKCVPLLHSRWRQKWEVRYCFAYILV